VKFFELGSEKSFYIYYKKISTYYIAPIY